jgi:protein-arginine kinase activator protein McsA
MECYHCQSRDLALAALWPYDRKLYAAIGIVMRICKNCGLEQNHCGDDETADPAVAAEIAPSQGE